MVLEFYNLREQPFGVTPDPKYLYFSPTHREALASLEYGITSGRGFLGLVAPPGMGKTTILFHLLQQLGKTARTVFIFQTHVTPQDFLRNLMMDLEVDDCGGDVVSMQAKLNELLLQEAKSGRRVVVVVDEAQNLEDSVLEHLRMLSNFETASEKLMQIVLAGQMQLAERLTSPSLVQLRQRISMMGRLSPFDREETERYVNHRLEIAGYTGQFSLFTRSALRLIAEASGGIPRNINNLCFNALSLGCVSHQRMIQGDTILEVIKDLDLTAVKQAAPVASETAVCRVISLGAEIGTSGVSRNKLPSWVPRFGLAALFLVMAVIGFTTIKSNQVMSHAERGQAPKSASAVVAAAPTSALPSAPTPEQGSNTFSQTAASLAPESESTTPPTAAKSKKLPDVLIPTKSIRVEQDQTLYSIAMSNLGAYSKENLIAIQELNPGLTNPNRIRTGQMIRIPETYSIQEATKTTTVRSVAEAEKHE